MANTTAILSVVSKEISRRFDARALLANSVNRQYDKPHGSQAWKANSGSSITIKQPQRYTATSGQTLSQQDNIENTATLDVSTHYHVGLGFTSAELTQDLYKPDYMKMFAKDYLDGAIDTLCAQLEGDLFTHMLTSTYNSAGTFGTAPTYAAVGQGVANLDAFRAPQYDRCLALNPFDAGSLNANQSTFFHQGSTISKNYDDGRVHDFQGLKAMSSPDIGRLTNGTTDGAYLVNGAAQTGATLAVDTGTGTLTAGQKFTIAGVNSVDPVSGNDTGKLQTFVVTAAYAGGAGNVSISPSITTSGAYQTVSGSPADNAAITELGAASTSAYQNMVYQKDAFVLGTAQLADIGVKYEVPIIGGGGDMSYKGSNSGLFMKLSLDGDISNYKSVARLDIRYGFGTLVPEWANVLQGAT